MIEFKGRRVVFLDVDGVLNAHEWSYVGGRRIVPDNVVVANTIFAESGAVAVISSSWRGLVNRGHMDLHGFTTMFATHGLAFPVVAVLPGVDHTAAAKGQLIVEFASQNAIAQWLTIDDSALTLPPGRFLRTNGHRGLEPHHAHVVRDMFAAIAAETGKGKT